MTDKLLELFSEGLDVPADELNDESSPDNTESWDSLAAMTLVSLLEDSFDIQLSTRDIMKMRTIGVARDVLRAKNVDV